MSFLNRIYQGIQNLSPFAYQPANQLDNPSHTSSSNRRSYASSRQSVNTIYFDAEDRHSEEISRPNSASQSSIYSSKSRGSFEIWDARSRLQEQENLTPIQTNSFEKPLLLNQAPVQNQLASPTSESNVIPTVPARNSNYSDDTIDNLLNSYASHVASSTSEPQITNPVPTSFRPNSWVGYQSSLSNEQVESRPVSLGAEPQVTNPVLTSFRSNSWTGYPSSPSNEQVESRPASLGAEPLNTFAIPRETNLTDDISVENNSNIHTPTIPIDTSLVHNTIRPSNEQENYHDLRANQKNTYNKKKAEKEQRKVEKYTVQLNEIENSGLSGEEMLKALNKSKKNRPKTSKDAFNNLERKIRYMIGIENQMEAIANRPMAITVEGFDLNSQHRSNAIQEMFKEKLKDCPRLRDAINAPGPTESALFLAPKTIDRLNKQLDFHENVINHELRFLWKKEKNHGAVKYRMPTHDETAYEVYRELQKSSEGPYKDKLFTDLHPKEARKLASLHGRGFEELLWQKFNSKGRAFVSAQRQSLREKEVTAFLNDLKEADKLTSVPAMKAELEKLLKISNSLKLKQNDCQQALSQKMRAVGEFESDMKVLSMINSTNPSSLEYAVLTKINNEFEDYKKAYPSGLVKEIEALLQTKKTELVESFPAYLNNTSYFYANSLGHRQQDFLHQATEAYANFKLLGQDRSLAEVFTRAEQALPAEFLGLITPRPLSSSNDEDLSEPIITTQLEEDDGHLLTGTLLDSFDSGTSPTVSQLAMSDIEQEISSVLPTVNKGKGPSEDRQQDLSEPVISAQLAEDDGHLLTGTLLDSFDSATSPTVSQFATSDIEQEISSVLPTVDNTLANPIEVQPLKVNQKSTSITSSIVEINTTSLSSEDEDAPILPLMENVSTGRVPSYDFSEVITTLERMKKQKAIDAETKNPVPLANTVIFPIEGHDSLERHKSTHVMLNAGFTDTTSNDSASNSNRHSHEPIVEEQNSPARINVDANTESQTLVSPKKSKSLWNTLTFGRKTKGPQVQPTIAEATSSSTILSRNNNSANRQIEVTTRISTESLNKPYAPKHQLILPANLSELFAQHEKIESAVKSKNEDSEKVQIAVTQRALSTLLNAQLALPGDALLNALTAGFENTATEQEREIAIASPKADYVAKKLTEHTFDGAYQYLKKLHTETYTKEFDSNTKLKEQAIKHYCKNKAQEELRNLAKLSEKCRNGANVFESEVQSRSLQRNGSMQRQGKTMLKDYLHYTDTVTQTLKTHLHSPNPELIQFLTGDATSNEQRPRFSFSSESSQDEFYSSNLAQML